MTCLPYRFATCESVITTYRLAGQAAFTKAGRSASRPRPITMSYEASRCSEMATRSFTIRSRTPPLHDLRLGRVRTAGQTGGLGTGAPMIGHRSGALAETGPQRARPDDRRGGPGAARPPSGRPPAGRNTSAGGPLSLSDP